MLYPDMPLVADDPAAFVAAARRYLKTVTGRVRTPAELDSLVTVYTQACQAARLPVGLLLAQMVHETDAMRSMWSQPPRRNPAGIGVTGAKDGNNEPVGQWFDTDAQGVLCHVGLVCCYRYSPTDTVSDPQQRLIDLCLSYRPSAPRGIAVTFAELAAKWAVDPDYVPKVQAVYDRVAAA
jgi:hypothetical protein